MEYHDTIAAPATPAGEGGIGIVRLSGSRAEDILLRFFHSSSSPHRLESHRLYHGHFHDSRGVTLDEVMAVIMRAPRSYTREDVVEIHCHGGNQVLRNVLDSLIDGGARLARPGEFTLRAFLNGRIDLSQAEAVIDLIRSRSHAAGRLALGQMEGKLSKRIYLFRDRLADVLALVEAHVDFPEEETDYSDFQNLEQKITNVAGEMERLLQTFDFGRILREGLSVLILGRPNVGKSSLMNALLGEARAIVTEIPGTTRDTIEEQLVLAGIPLRLIDTAGVRDTRDPVEQEGVRRAREKIALADLVLLVVDGSLPIQREDLIALGDCRGSEVLVVVNKSDLPGNPLPADFNGLFSVGVSARHGTGLDLLRDTIVKRVLGETGCDGVESLVLSDRRHREALIRSKEALVRCMEGFSGAIAPELLALELRDALDALGEITGETTPEDILERIFLRFCIGK